MKEDGQERDYVYLRKVWLVGLYYGQPFFFALHNNRHPIPAHQQTNRAIKISLPGYYALGDYERASRWNEILLRREPNNHQAINLQQQIADALDRGAPSILEPHAHYIC